jgi:hypothetical protein
MGLDVYIVQEGSKEPVPWSELVKRGFPFEPHRQKVPVWDPDTEEYVGEREGDLEVSELNGPSLVSGDSFSFRGRSYSSYDFLPWNLHGDRSREQLLEDQQALHAFLEEHAEKPPTWGWQELPFHEAIKRIRFFSQFLDWLIAQGDLALYGDN